MPDPRATAELRGCTYCDKPSVTVVHDARGCVPTCQEHADWRAAQSHIGGHEKGCPGD